MVNEATYFEQFRGDEEGVMKSKLSDLWNALMPNTTPNVYVAHLNGRGELCISRKSAIRNEWEDVSYDDLPAEMQLRFKDLRDESISQQGDL